MTKKIKAAIYTRANSPNKTNKKQLIELRKLCKSNDYKVAGEYSDNISGIKEGPGLKKMMKDMKAKNFEKVCVSGFDRIGRSATNLLRALEEMKNRGVEVITPKDTGSSTPAGKLFFTVISGLVELESKTK